MIKLPDFNEAKILVIGDVMLDRYWQGSTERMSPEAPVPVVNVKDCKAKAGGAGNVAMNLNVLGATTTLLGLVGEDEAGQALDAVLSEQGIHHCLLRSKTGPTITKLRVLGRGQQLVRLDFEESFTGHPKDELFNRYESLLTDVDVIVCSDYGKGTLSNVQALIALATKKNIPVIVDPKGRDFSIYHGATLVTPNLKEFEGVVGTCHSAEEMVTKGQALMRAHDFEALLITRGPQGMTLLQNEKEPVHFTARAKENDVVDVTGAGDTVVSTLAACCAAKMSFADASLLANMAAGVAVHRLGATAVTVPELRRAMQRYYNSGFGVVSEEELSVAVNDAKAHGEKVVMTNGCFDILHAGHVSFLERSRALGQRLIVALNDDASVKRLKGEERPINPIQKRMAVIAGLRSVDWVVSFSDDTPERLLEKIKPDILAKGDDYKSIEDVVGYEIVLDYGGEVERVGDDFNNSTSTTKIIEKILSES